MGGKISQEMPPSGGAKRWVDFWRGAIQPNFDTSSIPMSIFGMAALLTVRAKGAPACAWVMWLLHMAGEMGLHVTSKSRVCSSCCCSAWVPSKFSGSAWGSFESVRVVHAAANLGLVWPSTSKGGIHANLPVVETGILLLLLVGWNSFARALRFHLLLVPPVDGREHARCRAGRLLLKEFAHRWSTAAHRNESPPVGCCPWWWDGESDVLVCRARACACWVRRSYSVWSWMKSSKEGSSVWSYSSSKSSLSGPSRSPSRDLEASLLKRRPLGDSGSGWGDVTPASLSPSGSSATGYRSWILKT